MTTISLPQIHIPDGCESAAAELFEGLKQLMTFSANPQVVENPAMRTVTAGLEHSLDSAATQARAATPHKAA